MIISSKILFKITLFGNTFVLMRYPKEQLPDISRSGTGKQAHGAYIKQVDRYLFAVNENGEYIKGQRKLTLSDNVNEISTVTVEYPFAGIYQETFQEHYNSKQ